jgi:hypothetical protein
MHAYTVRRATESDRATLAWLGTLAGERPVARPALIADIDGIPAAAISLVDGYVVRDPFRPAPGLGMHLRLHRSGWRPQGTPRRQLRAAWPR